MKRFDYPRIRETYYETVLQNGLRIRVLYKPEFDKLYAVLAVNYGSVDMDYQEGDRIVHTPAGVAHYLEHKMFDLPAGNAMQRFSALGGSPNAFTGYGMTAYYVQTTQAPAENLRLLLEMVFTPHFTPESVEKERGIINQEINMYADNPDARLFELLFEQAYPGHPLSVSIAGSVGSVSEITAETLLQCYDAFYRPENMILCVEGNLSPDAVIRTAESVSAQRKDETIEKLYRDAAAEACRTGEHRVEMDVSMPMFAAGFPIPDLAFGDGKTEIAAELAMELLTGESSSLYQRMYESGLIDDGFSAGFDGVRNKAMLSVSGESADPAAVLRLVCAEASGMVKQGVDAADLDRLKKSMIGRRIRELDSFAGTCTRLCDAHFDGVDCFRFPDTIDSISEADIISLLQYITEDRLILVVIEPKEDLK